MVGLTSQAFLVPLVAAGLVFFVWRFSDGSERLRTALRSSYISWPWRGFFAGRMLLVSAPLTAPPIAAFAVSLLFPRQIAVWILVAIICWATFTVPLVYRVPPPFMPAWFARELADGRTPIQQPDRWDLGCMWAAVAFLALGALSFVALVVVYHAVD